MLITLALATSAYATVPVALTHTGRLLDNAGVPLDGPQTVSLSLFDSASATTPLWAETQTSVDFDNGYFAVQLGGDSSNPLDIASLDQPELWVEVSLNSSVVGRQRVLSTPYAVLARSAVDLRGGVVDASEIRVNGQLVIDNSGSLAGSLGCGAGQVAIFTGSAWSCTDNSWANLANVPADLLDGDDNTQLDEAAVDAFVSNNGYAMAADLNALDASLATLAKSGSWADLLDIPTDLADGDDNTQLDEAAVDAFVSNNGYAMAADLNALDASLATLAKSGSWADLLDIPGGFQDGIDDTLSAVQVLGYVEAGGLSLAGNLDATGLSISGAPVIDGQGLRVSSNTRFQDLVQTYEYSTGNPPQYGGDASIWDDECLEGGDILHFADVGNAVGSNDLIFTMAVPVAVSAFSARTRTHTGASYFGNARLYGSQDKSSWIPLATLSGDGVCVLLGPAQISSNTRWQYFKIELWGNARTTYESLSSFKIDLQ